jgi:hypothetical protein
MLKEFKRRIAGSKFGQKTPPISTPVTTPAANQQNIALIANCFKRLDASSKNLSHTIAQYVLTGEPVSVLDTFEGIDKDLLERAFVHTPRHYWPKKQDKKGFEEVSGYFDSFYCSDLLSDFDICRRWGLIRTYAVDRSPKLLNYDVQLPGWFNALMVDLSVFIHNTNDYPINQNHKTKLACIPFLNVSWLSALLVHYDFDEQVSFKVLLSRSDYYSQTNNTMDHLLTTIDLPSWLIQLDALTLLDDIDLPGKVCLIEHLGKYQKLDALQSMIIQLATDSAKTVRTQCPPLIGKLNTEQLLEYMFNNFADFATPRRKELAILIATYGGNEAINCLTELAQKEKSKSVTEAISHAIDNTKASKVGIDAQPMQLPDYQAVDPAAPIGENWLKLLEVRLTTQLENAKERAAQEIEENRTADYKSNWAKTSYKEYMAINSHGLNAALNSISCGKGRIKNSHVSALINACLLKDPEFSLSHIVNYLHCMEDISSLAYGVFPTWLSTHSGQLTDLRQLDDLFKIHGSNTQIVANWILNNRWESTFSLPKVPGLSLWPFFVENDTYISQAFGLTKSVDVRAYARFELAHGMLVVAQFKQIPPKYLLILYQHALSTGKTYGPLARQILTEYGVVEDRVISALTSAKQDERVVGANWLAELKFAGAIKPLQQALKKEKRELPKAAMLNALHQLGENIDSYLSNIALLKEAQTGLKKAIPKTLSWFPFETLPTAHWLDGKKVNPLIIKWWIVLACKLKQPGGNPLLDLYSARLNQRDRASLGLHLIRLFINQDTLIPNDAQAVQYAKANQQSTFDMWKDWAQSSWGKEYINLTLQDAYKSEFNQHKSEYLGSAMTEKGILALAGQANGAEAVEIVSRYMKDHYKRHHQVTAMISALGGSDDPVVIQLILSVARRHRTNSVQETAIELVQQVANRNGWTQDELADRTTPTAGLEANGTMEMSYGTRQLTVKLDDNMKIVLANESGKTIKSLPAARQDDDAEQVAQAKKDFSTCKKTLKQVIDLQGSRLYEAMCLERQWHFADWQQYLLEHPIMSRLVQRLVWVVEEKSEEKGENQSDKYQVRPTPELELIDIEDEDHTPSDDAKISIAHTSGLAQDEVNEWLAHFKSEKIKPLFSQFAQPAHQLSEDDKSAKQLNYHLGWVTDTFTLRSILTKRGYKRGQAEDGGSFTHYYKDFAAVGLRTVVEFSGSWVPEENMSAVLFHVGFVDPDDCGWLAEDDYKPLNEVPDVLISEAMLDYEAVAAKAAFNEQWQKKTPW